MSSFAFYYSFQRDAALLLSVLNTRGDAALEARENKGYQVQFSDPLPDLFSHLIPYLPQQTIIAVASIGALIGAVILSVIGYYMFFMHCSCCSKRIRGTKGRLEDDELFGDESDDEAEMELGSVRQTTRDGRGHRIPLSTTEDQHDGRSSFYSTKMLVEKTESGKVAMK